MLLQTTSYPLSSFRNTSLTLSVALLVPDRFPPSVNSVPFFRHWYVNVPEPATPTVKEAMVPALLVRLCGWRAMTGSPIVDSKIPPS